MDVRDLIILAAIAKHGSITKAADHLGMTQPGITKSLRHLEQELHVPLIERTRNGAIPTKFGEVLVRYGASIATEFNRGRAELYTMIEGLPGEVTVGSIAMGIGQIVPIAVHRVSQRHPGVSIGIREGSDDVLFSALQAGHLDLMFGPVMYGEKGLFDETVMFRDHLQICVSSSHPLAGRKTLKLETLLAYDWILPPRSSTLLSKITREFARLGHDLPKSHVETGSIRARIAFVTHTNRIALMPTHLIQSEIDAGNIVTLPVRLEDPVVAFGTATRVGATLNPVITDLAKEIRAVAGELGLLESPPIENSKNRR
jgi:molybdate transport repressor ModE-like protein